MNKNFLLAILLVVIAGAAIAGAAIYVTDSHQTPAPVAATPAPPPAPAASAPPPAPAVTDTTPPPVPPPAPPADANAGQPGMHGGQRMQQILSQLNLTDAQKQQIDQIRQTVTDRRERHEEIMKVLTPDQQAKFEQLRPRRYNGGGGGAPDSATTPTPAPAPSPPPAPPPGN